MEVLNFDMSGEAQERLAAFDRAIIKYEDATKTSIPTNLKVGIVLKQMPESALRQHLILNLERWNSYERLRQEIENIARAQVASSGAAMPMDLGALGQATKGNKGKDKVEEARAISSLHRLGLVMCAANVATLLEIVGRT
eukprot:1577990-Amphidinium_carterae.1